MTSGAVPSAAELMNELPPGSRARGYPEPSAWYVSLLLVVPEARGGGIGAELYAHVEELARARGGTAMRLTVQRQNARALAFWTRRGFVIEATGTQHVGRPNAVARLVKRLS